MKKPPIRLWIAVMVFLTTYTNYTVRVNLSVSIVAMVKAHKGQVLPECKRNESITTSIATGASTAATTAAAAPGSTAAGAAGATTEKAEELPDYGTRYDWDQNIQGMILGSYFYGYVISNLLAGWMAEWFGPFKVIFWVHVIGAIFNSLIPVLVSIHFSLLVVCRIILGFGAGLIYPAIQCLIARWSPPSEKGKFMAAMMGNNLGTCVTWPLVGAVTESLGWPWGFHIVTIQNAVFCIIFFFVAADSPADHKHISPEERDYIIDSQSGSVTTKKAIPPYLKMFTSLPFWILTICHFGNEWGLYLQLTGVPKFMSEVVGFDLTKSGGLSALAPLMRMVFGMTFGALSDFIKEKGVSNTFIRKFFTLFSHVLSGLLLIGISFAGCHWIPVVVMLALSMGSNGAASVTNLRNPQDLAPNFAGTIYGIITFIGGMTGFIVPSVTGALTQENNGVSEWGWNFRIGGIMYIACGTIFIFFGSAKQQSWNEKSGEP